MEFRLARKAPFMKTLKAASLDFQVKHKWYHWLLWRSAFTLLSTKVQVEKKWILWVPHGFKQNLYEGKIYQREPTTKSVQLSYCRGVSTDRVIFRMVPVNAMLLISWKGSCLSISIAICACEFAMTRICREFLTPARIMRSWQSALST